MVNSVARTPAERITAIEVKSTDYERWNIRQNGRLDKIDDKLEAIHNWLLTSVGGLCIAVILIAINLALK